MKAAGKRPPATPRLGARLRREACQGESARNPRVHMDLARQAPSPTLTRALHAGGPAGRLADHVAQRCAEARHGIHGNVCENPRRTRPSFLFIQKYV